MYFWLLWLWLSLLAQLITLKDSSQKWPVLLRQKIHFWGCFFPSLLFSAFPHFPSLPLFRFPSHDPLFGSSANPFLHRPFPFLPDWLHGLSDHAQRLYGKCVRLSRPLVVFWTYFKLLHFHSFIHSFSFAMKQPSQNSNPAIGSWDIGGFWQLDI